MSSETYLDATEGMMVIDSETIGNATKFFLICSDDVKFSDLVAINDQLHPKEIIVCVYESKKSPSGDDYQMKIIVENKEKIESSHLPRNFDSINSEKRSPT